MDDDLVLTEFKAETGVATLWMNRPKALNAIDVPLARAFQRAVANVAASEQVRCIVIAGVGRAFVAGGDVAAFGADFNKAGDVVNDMLDAIHPAILALRAGDAPVIVAVRGVAAGAGFSLVLGADLVVAEENARFLIAYDKVGASPDCGGTWFLPRKVGLAKSMELMLLGSELSARDAETAGIVNRVVADEALDDAARALAEKVAAGPTRAFGAFRRLTDDALDQDLSAHLENERAAFVAATKTRDFREGVTAFMEKRRPTFGGR